MRRLFNQLDRWVTRRVWSHRYRRWRCAGWKTLPTRRLRGELGLVSLIGLIPSLASRRRKATTASERAGQRDLFLETADSPHGAVPGTETGYPHPLSCDYQKVNLLAIPHIPTSDLNAVRTVKSFRVGAADVVAHVIPARVEGCGPLRVLRRSRLSLEV